MICLRTKGVIQVSVMSLATALVSAPAYAQSADRAPPAADDAPLDSNIIIVTAQKRAEAIDRVGLAIAAFSGDDLERRGIASVSDLPKVVPGLTYSDSATGTPVYTLRGIGFYETSIAAYPAVTVYTDQVPLSFPAMTSFAAFDVERVEVLKGPQGILFGQNSTGGAINYIARKPKDTLDAGVELGYGRFNEITATGYVGGPLADGLKARVAVKYRAMDDWQHSFTRDDEIGEKNEFVGRFLLDWDPASNLRFELSVNGFINKSDPLVPQYSAINKQFDIPFPLLDNLPFAPDSARAADWPETARPRQDQKFYQIALRGDWDVGEDMTVTSISAYGKFKRNDTLSTSGVNLLQNSVTPLRAYVDEFFQEIRIANGGNNRLRYIFGGNYSKANSRSFQYIDYGQTTIAQLFGFGISGGKDTQHMRNVALFGNLEFDVSSQFTVKAGARYTDSKRSYSGCNIAGPGQRGQGVVDFYRGLSESIVGHPVTIPDDGCLTIETRPGNPNFGLPGAFEDTLSEDNLSWRVGIDFKPTEHALIYANVAKGYKAGSYPTVVGGASTQFFPVVQESVVDYELGVKLSMFDRKLSLESAVFYYDYKNKQLRSKLADDIFGPLDALQNVPKSEVFGIEGTIRITPAPGFTIVGSGTYVDSKVGEFVALNAVGVQEDFTGSKFPFTPKWQFSGSADYEFAISSSAEIFLGASIAHSSRSNASLGRDPVTRLPAVTLIDLRAGIQSTDGSWRASVYGKNIANEFYWTNVVRTLDTTARYPGMPATYGVSLSYRFR